MEDKRVLTHWGYRVTQCVMDTPELGEYTTCGMEIRDLSTPGEQIVGTLVDISPDRHYVEQLAALFESAGLSPVHFKDVVCDILE
jgi:hypothetical protein